jgi:hypothetical protein
MATLNEYYLKDFSRLLSSHTEWTLQSPTAGNLSVTTKVHLDFDSNTFFLSFFIPKTENEVGVFNLLLIKQLYLLNYQESRNQIRLI